MTEVVAGFRETGFAVIDGGQFEDLPSLLRRDGLFGRSLFLDHADIEIERAGPWLVALAQVHDAAERVLGLVGDAPAALFWSCTGGEAVLYRHLRTINQARIPAWAAAGGLRRRRPAPANPSRP